VAYQLPIINAVENACLLHDIGNPPFGHFGESAIKEWFKEEWEDICKQACSKINSRELIERLTKDFVNFDGNPQGLRIILHLQTDLDEYSLNLTYTTILSFIKYVVSSSEIEVDGTNPLKKKAGFFESEKQIIEDMKAELGIDKKLRHPLAYIMEAADDISYCISDIEDGIEKKIISVEDFFFDLLEEWQRTGEGAFPFGEFPDFSVEETQKGSDDSVPFSEFLESKNDLGVSHFLEFKTSYVREAIKKAAEAFIDKRTEFLKGNVFNLFDKESLEHKAIECLKSVARKRLYRSSQAENPELAGHEIVTGLLNCYRPLMELPKDLFDTLLASRRIPSERYGKNLDLHWRLFNKIPEKHLKAYEYQVKKIIDKPGQETKFYEWYYRVHLIIDNISGMTDRFALEQYQLLKGIRYD
jgi:dGTPase